jgi:hypothetical protein
MGGHMRFETVICGKAFKYETPADLIEQIRPHMEKAEVDYKALKFKAEDAYRKNKEESDKMRRIYFVFRKAVEQLGGKPPAGRAAASGAAPESKANAG